MKKMDLIAEQFLQNSIERFQREKLLQLIDEALDKQDKRAFRVINRKVKSIKAVREKWKLAISKLPFLFLILCFIYYYIFLYCNQGK